MTNTRVLSMLLALSAAPAVQAQAIFTPSERACAEGAPGVHVTPFYSDSLASSFLICIDAQVAPHLHQHHTEHVVVVDGEGIMHLGDIVRTVKAGDVIIIPAGTVHSVRVTGAVPLRVISVQSPRYDGSDRVLVSP